MKALNLFLISVILVLMYSCGSTTPQTKLKVSLAAVTGSANFPGGLVVMGAAQDGSQKFLRVVETVDDKLELELNQGKWDFLVMGWDGASNFEGDNYCDFLVDTALDKEEVALTMEASKLKCNALDRATNTIAMFGPSDSLGQFPKFVFNSCGGVKHYIAEGKVGPQVYCGPGNTFEIIPGGLKSFKVSMGQLFPDGTKAIGMVSACVSESSLNGETRGFSNLKIPHGSPLIEFFYKVEAYSDLNCQNLDQAVVYETGLFGIDPTGNSMSTWDPASNFSQFYLHSELCNSAQIALSPFGNGDPAAGESRLICSKQHWANIDNDLSSNIGESYILGKDIDLGGSNTTFTNTFKGSLRGNMHAIRNGNNPLLGDIQVVGSNDVRISDLYIEGMNIDVNAAGSYGVLAQSVTGTSVSQRIEIDHVELSSNNLIKVTSGPFAVDIGGLIGKIDFSNASTTNEFFIRKIDSKVSVDGSLNTDTSTSSYGGLVGKASGHGSGGFYLVAEEFLVGVANKDDFSDQSSAITLKGQHNIGGVIGHANYFEVRGMGVVNSKIYGKDSVGGVVGYANNKVQVSGVFTNTVLKPLSGTGTNFGGVLGKKPSGGFDLHISDVIANVSAPNNGNIEIHSLGGIAGSIYQDGSSSNTSISNVKAVVNFGVDGNTHGGIIGDYSDMASSTPQSSPVIYNSLVTGSGLYVEDSSSTNNNTKGGFVGSMNQGVIELSRVKLNGISAYHTIGGAIGSSVGSKVRESKIEFSSITAFHGIGTSMKVGGVFGQFSQATMAVAGVIDGVKAGGTIVMSNFTGDCSVAHCGKIIGSQDDTSLQSSLVMNTIGEVTVQDGRPVTSPQLCGASNVNCTSEFTNVSDIANSLSCSAMADGRYFDDSGICKLLFITKWDAYGYDALANLVKVGNKLEPFSMSKPEDWNAIGTDKLLLTKSYELKNDIDFNGLNITPLGSDDEADGIFSGSIFSNGHRLLNVSYSGSDLGSDGVDESDGIVSMLRHGGQIGDRDEPLVIENMTLNCTANNCGVVGKLMGGSVHVIVKNGLIQGSVASNVGGIVGSVPKDYGDISNSGFEGIIEVGSASNVGGLVGRVSDSVAQTTANLRIDESYARLNKIQGTSNVGGLVGFNDYYSGSPRLDIEESYVWINNGVSGDDIVGSNVAGAVGFTADSAQLEIRDFYVDFSSANVPAGFAPLANKNTSPIYSLQNVYVLGNASGGIGTVGTNYEVLVSHDAIFNKFDDDRDWAIDLNGKVRLYWELFGFHDH